MRVLAGKFAGRDLMSPGQGRVRPTAEHVRAAMLDAVAADLPRATVLDLFAGTGALGLEAMSRGATSVDFVEFGPSALHALKANIARLRLLKRTRVFKKDALPFAAALPAGRYDLAFADPPYDSRQLNRLIDSWLAVPFARILVAEHSRDHVLPPGGALRLLGDSAYTIYRAPSPGRSGSGADEPSGSALDVGDSSTSPSR